MVNFRYINASDVSKVLGKKYGNVWVKKNEVLDIIHNRRKLFNNKPPTFDLNEKTIQAIQESNMGNEIIPKLNKLKKEIIHKDNFEDYSLSKEDLLNNLPNKRLKRAIDEDLTMDRGNVEEERIIIEQSIKKDNVLHFYTFKVQNKDYRVGCRFDGHGVEIKCRKNKFLGVPMYEKVQLHFYMAAINANEWILKEKYNDVIVDHIVQFDNDFFENVKNDLHDLWEENLKE